MGTVRAERCPECDALIGAGMLYEHQQRVHRQYADAFARGKAEGIAEERARSRYLAFDVGCIECGESSAVIGLYPSLEEAEAACKQAKDEQEKDWRGQHSMEVFDLRADAPPADRSRPAMALILSGCYCEVSVTTTGEDRIIRVVKPCAPHRLIDAIKDACTRDNLAYPQPLDQKQRDWFHIGREHMKQEINSILERAASRPEGGPGDGE